MGNVVRKPSKAVQAVITTFLAIGLLFAGLTGTYWLAVHNQEVSDHRWCAALELLTNHPVPKPSDPKANPSREVAYQGYLDFLLLRHQFGCDK